jgi:hypothetical protein
MSESSKEIKLTYARSGEIYPDPLSLDVVLRDIHHLPNRKKWVQQNITFQKFFRCSNDFITQKVYFSRLMRVYVGLIMLVVCT